MPARPAAPARCTTRQISLSAVVPEPAAWMLFLAGFALLGVIVRTRLR
ncbi:MAG: PEP-CTERM sorting domain-containing protein [Bacteroidota bacterium]